MIFDIILAYTDVESTNKNASFPRKVIEEYINSDRCKSRLEDGLMLGSITHKYRYGAEEIEGLGLDDRMLDEGVITHVIRKLWLDGSKIMATIEIFDDETQYSPEQLGKLKQLLRLVKNKVRLPLSIVTDAEWTEDGSEQMTYLYELIGFDFTLNPAFKGAKSLVE